MTIAAHRQREYLGGVVSLLTIDATSLTDNASHIRRFVNHHGEVGTGVIYQGNTFVPHPYKIPSAKRSSKSNKSGSKVFISDLDNYSFSRFVDSIGGELEGARIYEVRVYETFLDGGATPNINAFSKRFDHLVNYLEDSDKIGEIIIHTIDPLSKALKVPALGFSSGAPNSEDYSINVFPAVDRSVAKV